MAWYRQDTAITRVIVDPDLSCHMASLAMKLSTPS